MPKTIYLPSVSKNFWNYYFVKWSFKNKSNLILNTVPNTIILDLSRWDIKYKKWLFKIMFNLVKENRIKYYKSRNKMVIYSADKKNSKECTLNIMALETIEKTLNLNRDFCEYNAKFFLIEIIKGIKFLIRKNVVSDIQILEEIFIENEYSFLYPYIKEGIVLDIGANIGDTAILFSMKGAKKIYAYEPHPYLCSICLKNIELNNLQKKIEVEKCGVGEKNETLVIKEDNFFAATGTFGLKECAEAREIKIKIVSFSEIIEKIQRIDVLKMDCEGCEFSALLSCPKSSLRKIKVMGIEYHKDPSPLIKYLKEAGFDVEIKKENKMSGKRKVGLLFAILK